MGLALRSASESRSSRYAFSVFPVAAIFALSGCGGAIGNASPSVPAAGQAAPASALNVAASMARHVPQAYTSLYNFLGHPSDGAAPEAGLINVGGTLYGVTYGAGEYSAGTVFKITTTGQESVLYNFGASAADGKSPVGSLLDVDGTLYGTTFQGGTNGKGTVFKVTPAGQESVLYNFSGQPNDGDGPAAGLINVGGTLYGTTAYGGTSGNGTAFKITTAGHESVLYNFGVSKSDGETPQENLLDAGGTLYGTTYLGGASGEGTVFALTTAGQERVLHSFAGAPDGAGPAGALVAVGGTLYGTTVEGGEGRCDCGTVFSITAAGKENVLYSFGSSPKDGQYPYAGLISVGDALYGTTDTGGAPHGTISGTVFKITTRGRETVLYRFGAQPGDGSEPRTPLLAVGGTLYGTAFEGGKEINHCRAFPRGCGTVFSIAP
jgi:uncharacterized repeat protein (TIGR03803 family)